MRGRAPVLLIILSLMLLGVSKEKRLHVDLKGHAPSMAFDALGALHVAYVDERGVVYRAASSAESSVVSPPGAKPDAHGEVGPVLTLTGDRGLMIVYSDHNAHNLAAQRSNDGGRTWSAPVAVNDDGKPSSHSFFDSVGNRTGDVVVSWLDSRGGHQGVQSALIRDTISPNKPVDPITCECCRIALLTASDGAVWLAYRDEDDNNVRNIAYAISRDGGASFTRMGLIADDGWRINGCPDSGPRLTQTKDGTVYAAWFNGAAPAIEVARFRGKAFEAAQRIAAPDAVVTMVNHPEIGTLPDGRLIVLYEAVLQAGTPVIMARAGEATPVIVARNAITPRYARRGERAAIAYTQRIDGKHTAAIIDWRDAIGGVQ
jgi:hypothetical protein